MIIPRAGELLIMQEDTLNEQIAKPNEVFKHGCIHVAVIIRRLKCHERFYFKI
jgi:hypothetical protein